MKKIILIFAVAMTAVACTSKTTTDPIVGTWVSDSLTLTFNSDKTASSKNNGILSITAKGTYTIVGDKITTVFSGITTIFTFSIKSDTLTLTAAVGGNVTTYKKQ